MSSTPAQPEQPAVPTPAPAPVPATDQPAASADQGGPDQPDEAAAPDDAAVPAERAEPDVVIPTDGPLSDEQIAAIAATAQPATLRRAPRYRAFFWTGALVGIVLGVALGLWLSDDGMINRWIYVTVTVLGTTLVTTLVAGASAALVDKRGAARAAQQRGGSAGR